MDEFQIAVSIICHSAIRFVGHLGESMVTHGKDRNLMVFNNLDFFGHGLAFFLKRCLATLNGRQDAEGREQSELVSLKTIAVSFPQHCLGKQDYCVTPVMTSLIKTIVLVL